MPERHARTETLRAVAAVTVGAVTLLPIERVVSRSIAAERFAFFAATKDVFAVVVRDAAGTRALGAGGVPISLEELRARMPGLDLELASM